MKTLTRPCRIDAGAGEDLPGRRRAHKPKDRGMETAGVPDDPYWRFRQEEAERSRRSRRLLIGALVFLIIVLVFLLFLLYRYTHGILLGSRIGFLPQMKSVQCFGLRILTGCGPGASL